MIENTSEINYDYIDQKMLYLLLIRGCSVIIRPFEYGTKLDGLFELLRSFYLIEEIDMNEISNPEHLEGFLCQYDDNEKKSILLLKNVTQETANEVVKYPEILFIALEKNQTVDYTDFKKVAVFNKKIKKWSLLIPKSLISVNSLSYDWINEKIILSMKSDGIFEVKDYLSKIYEKVSSLFAILPAMSKSLYYSFCSESSSQEQKSINAICEHYYNVKLPEFTKRTIVQKTVVKPEIAEIAKTSERKENNENNENIIKSRPTQESFDEKEINPEIQISSEVQFDNEDQIHTETQINEEIWNLLNGDNGGSGYNALSTVLGDIELSANKIFSTPEKKYYYLRTNQWKTQIPFDFFKKLFLYYVREEIKNDNVPKTNIKQYLMDKHNQLVDICSMIASPEFKRMDPTQFAGDEILKSYLKKEPMVSHVLPVQSQRKAISPKELGKLFSQDIPSVNKDDFNEQYQKNLERLKEEYGEREINLELVGKLRNRTKELQSKISALFQD